jgi:hypothetical protein
MSAAISWGRNGIKPEARGRRHPAAPPASADDVEALRRKVDMLTALNARLTREQGKVGTGP